MSACLCGAIAFTLRYLSKWVGADTEQVQIDDEDELLTWYQEPSGSSRGFCRRCGSPMFFRSLRDPGETHMPMALFTQAIDRLPGSHEHYDTHVAWVSVAETLPIEPEA
jgi:hypothetical protein